MVTDYVLGGDFKVLADGVDITSSLKKYISELTVTDHDKDTADELVITLSKRFKRPAFGSKLKVYLGWETDAELQYLGLFNLSSSTITDNKAITLNATAIDYQKTLKERRFESFEITLEELIASIADKNGLRTKINITSDRVRLFEQNNESDLAFLNRLAKKYNATFNVKNDTIYFVQGKENKPSVTINLDECHSSSITESAPTLYKSAKAHYQDTKQNKVVTTEVGSGEPCLWVKGSWHTEEDAIEDITNALKRANQAEVEGSLTKRWERVFSGSEVVIGGTSYGVKKVIHSYRSNGALSLQLEFNNDLKDD